MATGSSLPPERLLLSQRLHWGVFVMPAVAILLALLYIFLLRRNHSFFGTDSLPPVTWGLRGLMLMLILPGLVCFISRMVAYDDTLYSVTTRRATFHTGWFLQIKGELALTHIETVLLIRSWLGRLLGYGTVVVVGNSGTWYSLRFLPHPRLFHRTCMEALEAVRTGIPLPLPPENPPPVPRPGSATPRRRRDSDPSPFAEVPKTPLQQAWEEMTKPIPDAPPDDSRYQPKPARPSSPPAPDGQ